jgi:hypothetical protein
LLATILNVLDVLVSDFGMVFGIGCIGCHVKIRGSHLDLCIAEVAEMSGAPCVKLHVG